MVEKIILKRGNKADLPEHATLGEPLFCVDTKELHIGMGDHLPIESLVATKVHLQSPDGSIFALKVDNEGVLSADKL